MRQKKSKTKEKRSRRIAMFNGRDYLIGGIYHCKCRFGHLPRFLRRIEHHFINLPFKREHVLKKLEEIICHFEVKGKLDDAAAEKKAIQSDLRLIADALSDQRIANQIEADVDISASLKSCKTWAMSELRRFGLHCSDPEIFIVDALPPPFDRASYSAFCADMGDFEQYGIKPGIYFPKNQLRPIYSRYLLLHEIIHYVLGLSHPEQMGRGLEEGICEVLGSILLSKKYFGSNLTRNLFIYNRLSSDINQFWELYLDYTRHAVVLYQRFGLEGVINLVREGRPAIKKIEAQILGEGKITFPFSAGEAKPEIEQLMTQLTFFYGRHLCVSPLAFLIHQFVKPGATIEEIANHIGLTTDACRKAIMELQDQICVSVLRPDGIVVSFSDTPMLFDAKAIRYVLS